MQNWPWSGLGIEATGDRTVIKRAYAARLKSIDRQVNIDQLQNLRDAYEVALASLEAVDAEPIRDVANAAEAVRQQAERPGDSLARNPLEHLRDINDVADEIAAQVVAARSAEDVESILHGCRELDDLQYSEWFSYELCIRLFGKVVSLPALQTLSARFGWDDLLRLRHWPRETIEPLNALFVTSRHEQELLERQQAREELMEGRYFELRRQLHSGDVPGRLRIHAWVFRGLLQSTLDWRRAFLSSLVPFTDMTRSTTELRNFLGADFADRIVTPEMVAFAEHVQKGGEDTAVALAGWFGRAVGSALALGIVVSMLQAAYGWNFSALWHSMVFIGLASLFLGALQRSHHHLLRERARQPRYFFTHGAMGRFAREVLLYGVIWVLLIALLHVATV